LIRIPAFLLVMLTAASTLLADVEVEVRFGHGGRAVVGAVTPTLVRLKSVGEQEPVTVSITVQANRGMFRGERCTAFGTLGPGAEKDFRFYLRPTANGHAEVDLTFGRPVIVVEQSKSRIGPTRSTRIVSAIPRAYSSNKSPAAIQLLAVGPYAGKLPRGNESVQIMPVEEADLPDVWHGFDGLDTVYLRNPFQDEPADPVRLAALLTWVELGGTLVISATRRPDLVRASILGDVLPGALGSPAARAVSYRDLARHFLPTGANPVSVPAVGPWVEIVPLAAAQVVTRASISGQDRVVSVSGNHGLGWISLLAFDPARFETAPSLFASAVLLRVMGVPKLSPENTIGNIENAFAEVEQYPAVSEERDYTAGLLRILKTGAVKPPPILLLSLFMLLYVLAVGPIDYFMLKRKGWLKYSALSFVILAVVFSATAWFVSFYLFAGAPMVNRVTFVDIVPDPGTSGQDLVAISDYSGYYEPRGGTRALMIEAETEVFSQIGTLNDYQGWGGRGLAVEALEVNAVDPARHRATLRIPFRSMRTARLLALRRELIPLTVEFDADSSAMIVQNDLPYALENAIIATPDGIIPVGFLASGGSRSCPLQERVANVELPNAVRLTSDPDIAAGTLIDQLGPLFFAVGRYLRHDPVPTGEARILEKGGFARPYTTVRNRSVLIAWTDARDPFRLPGGEEDGFRVTVIRRVLEP